MAARMTVCDPVHRILDFGAESSTKELVKTLIDSRPFQRLRRISQLGLAAHVFPGATHSRFAHCLGAGYLARSVSQQLKDVAPERSAELTDFEPLTIAAALLHDVGHGPFSHAFESVLKHVTGKKIKHEAWTRAIIRNLLHKELSRNDIEPELLASVFAEKARLQNRVTDEATPKVPRYIKQIISSQLDVDRMDYLVRDAHFSGVPMGHIDLHYLIRSLVPVEHAANDGDHATLGLSYKGVKSYEAFALARHLMNKSVYYHAKVAVLELLMEECLREIVINMPTRARGIPDSVQKLAQVKAAEPDEFAERYLDAYMDLTEDHVWTAFSYVERNWTGRAQSRAQNLSARLLARQVPRYFYVHPGKSAELETILLNARIDKSAFKVIAKKSRVYGEDDDSEPVYVFDENSQTNSSVTGHSFALTAFAGKSEDETLLVVLDDGKHDAIERAAERCVSTRAPLKPLVKAGSAAARDRRTVSRRAARSTSS